MSALVRHPEKLPSQPNPSPLATDVLDTTRLSSQLHGFDAVISAFSGHAQSNTLDYYLQGMASIIAAVKQAGMPRFLVVGGAGSLDVAPGLQLMDSPGFPDAYRATAEGARQALVMLRQEPELNWTMLSPSAVIAPGQRTGKFRLGSDQLLAAADGSSHVCLENYAMAMLDELEQPAHRRQRFTVDD